MNAEILAIGTELLIGQIVNTNARFISERLNSIGVDVYYHSVVGDNPARIKGELTKALQRCDLIIITGGLGPTQDDLTKDVIASVFNRKLVIHEGSLTKIECYFKRMGREMVDSNTKQAYFPEGAIIIENNRGTAPGCILEEGGKIIIMLPGPPAEMQPMLDNIVIPYLREKSGYKTISKYLKVFGIGESQLEKGILDLIDTQDTVTIATYAKQGLVTIRLTSKSKTSEEGYKNISLVEQEIAKRLKDQLYSTKDEELEFVTADLLIKNNITLALAESCTGGMISSKITGVPGISKVFKKGIISYSNQSKIDELGVSTKTLEKFGDVSEETAMEMAVGIRKSAKTDLGLSVTGYAGPEAGEGGKPVGLVYIALSDKDGCHCKELKLSGGRERIRNMSTLYAFDIIRRYLLGETGEYIN